MQKKVQRKIHLAILLAAKAFIYVLAKSDPSLIIASIFDDQLLANIKINRLFNGLSSASRERFSHFLSVSFSFRLFRFYSFILVFSLPTSKLSWDQWSCCPPHYATLAQTFVQLFAFKKYRNFTVVLF